MKLWEEGMCMAKTLTYSDAWESHVQVENISLSVVINVPKATDSDRDIPVSTMHTHIYHELFACGKGSITITTDDRTLHLDAGDIAIVPIGKRHYLNENTMHADYEVIGFLCTPTGSQPHSILYKALCPLLNSTQVPIYRSQPALYSQIQKITADHDHMTTPDCRPALQTLMILLDIIHMQPDTDEPEPANTFILPPHASDIQRLNVLEQLIAHNYMQPVRIDDFAEKLHISIRQLARIVEKRYGKTLHRIIMDKRLESAENLLLYSDLTVEKIAISVGFQSKASFYREFSRKHRMTPVQFRELVPKVPS